MRYGRLTRVVELAGAVLASCGLLYCAETPIPAPPTHWVTDIARFLSPEVAGSLDARLAAWQNSTGHQFLVYIAPTTGDDPIEDWAVRSFANWKVGRKGLDDGLVLFIMSGDRKLRIEVGYGLEGAVPDAIASRIINEVIVPGIRAGNANGAVTAGIDALIHVIDGPTAAVPGAPKPAQPVHLSVIEWILYGLAGLVVLIFFITHPVFALFLLSNIMSGGNGRGGGGGGFSGGGGRSGGGGASGSW